MINRGGPGVRSSARRRDRPLARRHRLRVSQRPLVPGAVAPMGGIARDRRRDRRSAAARPLCAVPRTRSWSRQRSCCVTAPLQTSTRSRPPTRRRFVPWRPPTRHLDAGSGDTPRRYGIAACSGWSSPSAGVQAVDARRAGFDTRADPARRCNRPPGHASRGRGFRCLGTSAGRRAQGTRGETQDRRLLRPDRAQQRNQHTGGGGPRSHARSLGRRRTKLRSQLYLVGCSQYAAPDSIQDDAG